MPDSPRPSAPAGAPADFTARVPPPVLETVDNLTPYPHVQFDCMGKGRAFYDVIAVKGSFELAHGPLRRSTEQQALRIVDTYHDENSPETSSLAATDELELYKPGTDVLITGTVRSPDGKAQREWGGMLRVMRNARGRQQVLLQKSLRFTGPRQWRHHLLAGWSLGKPEETTAVPLRYELAYGGHWINPKEQDSGLAREVYAANPSGSGHFGKSHATGQSYPGPQIEHHPGIIHYGNRPYTPGGFGPIAKFWQPRLKHAGTYDDAWHRQFQQAVAENDLPDYPADFDYAYFQSAPADQIIHPWLGGDEQIGLAGLFAHTPAMIPELPGERIHCEALDRHGREHEGELRLDTVHIDLDARRIFLVWRISLEQTLGMVRARLELRSAKDTPPKGRKP